MALNPVTLDRSPKGRGGRHLGAVPAYILAWGMAIATPELDRVAQHDYRTSSNRLGGAQMQSTGRCFVDQVVLSGLQNQ